jgi:mannose-6-phosphate isomerase
MERQPLYPMILSPHLYRPLWGGWRLAREFSKGGSSDARIGESWEIYEENPVCNGPLAGETLKDLAERFGERLLGIDGVRKANGRFPLLVKLIDAGEDLSIQVHPNDEQALRLEGQPWGKTEAWYVLSGSPGARLVYGLSREVSRRELRERAVSGTIEEILHYVSVKPEDAFLVDANTIHSIGSGIFLYEVQRPSNVTYRLYDWDRKTPDGRSREIHLDKAVEVANLKSVTRGRLKPVRTSEEDSVLSEELVRCPHFVLERLTFSRPWTRSSSGRSFEALTVTRGAVKIADWEESFGSGYLGVCQSILVPAALSSYTLVPEGVKSQVLLARLPE